MEDYFSVSLNGKLLLDKFADGCDRLNFKSILQKSFFPFLDQSLLINPTCLLLECCFIIVLLTFASKNTPRPLPSQWTIFRASA